MSDAATNSEHTGTTASPARSLLGRVHPLGWVLVGVAVLGLLLRLKGSGQLLGRMGPVLWGLLLLGVALCCSPTALDLLRRGIEAVTAFTGMVAKWMGWLVFLVSLFNVVTRYTGRYIERDIIIGQATTLAWLLFGFMFLVGMNYGVRAGVNPRIDFWWADFSPRRKAWLDFVMHTFFFLPFTIVATRILWTYSRAALGMKYSGAWPDGWRVWRSWEQHSDADQLPVGPIKAMLFIGFILLLLQVLAEIIRTGFVMMGRDDLSGDGDDDEGAEAPMRIE